MIYNENEVEMHKSKMTAKEIVQIVVGVVVAFVLLYVAGWAIVLLK